MTTLAGPIGTSLAVLATAALGGFVAHVLIFRALGGVAQRLRHPLVDALVVEARRPARALCPLLGVELGLPAVTLPRGLLSVLEHAVDLALIAAGAWLVIRGIDVVASRASVGYGPGAATEAKARRINTQYHIIRRILVVLVVALAVSLMLLTFDKVRAVGASILASAGIAALIGGLAVRPVVGWPRVGAAGHRRHGARPRAPGHRVGAGRRRARQPSRRRARAPRRFPAAAPSGVSPQTEGRGGPPAGGGSPAGGRDRARRRTGSRRQSSGRSLGVKTTPNSP